MTWPTRMVGVEVALAKWIRRLLTVLTWAMDPAVVARVLLAID